MKANAGVVWSADVFQEQGKLMTAIVLGLVACKASGIFTASWLALRSGIAAKSGAYSWRQLAGAGALGGIGFKISLFIAGLSLSEPDEHAAAKIAIFLASIIAALLGASILYPQRVEEVDSDDADHAIRTGSPAQ